MGMRNRNKLDKHKGEVEETGGNPSDVGGERYRSWNTGSGFGGGILGRQIAFLSASIVLVCVVSSDSLLNPFVLDDVTKVVCVRVFGWVDMPGSHLPVSHPLSCAVSVFVSVFAFAFIPELPCALTSCYSSGSEQSRYQISAKSSLKTCVPI